MSGRFAAMPLVALLAGLAGLALLVLMVWLESWALTNPRGYSHPAPRNFAFPETPRTALGLDFEDMEFAAANGDALRGWHVPAQQDSTRVGVVVLHGRGGDRTGAWNQIRILHDLGAGVATIDMRENGLSAGSGRGTALGMRESEDAILATAEMRQRGYEKVVLLGCSLGASAAILAAARDQSIDGVIADSALASFDQYVAEIADARLARFGVRARWATALWGRAVVALTRARLGLRAYERPMNVIADIEPRPVLLVYGSADAVTSPETQGAEFMSRAGSRTSLWVVDGGDHCDAAYRDPETYRARLVDLLHIVNAVD